MLRESKAVEETAEAVIPDACPDASEILYTGGRAFPRGRDLGEGTASVSAGVSAAVLVRVEGRDSPEIVEAYMPISVRLEDGAIRPGLESSLEVTLRRLDSQLVNPRKVMIRATVSVTLRVYEPCRERHASGDPTGTVELLLATEPVKVLTAMGEKTCSLEDTLRLSPEGTGLRVADCRMEVSHTEQRLTGTRAILKGDVNLNLLYLDEDGKLRTGQARLPFSQYIDLGDCAEDDELILQSLVTGADVDFLSDGGLGVTLQMLSRAEVWSRREIRYVQDLYALNGQAAPAFGDTSYESLLDTQLFSAVGRGSLPDAGENVCFTACVPGELSHARNGETVEFTLPVSVQVLWQTEGGLMGGRVRVNLTCATRAASKCRFEARAEDLTATAEPGAEGLNVKVTGNLRLRTWGVAELREITGCEVSEAAEGRDRPGLIIRRPGRQEKLWDIAKQYRTTREAIQAANGISGEPEPGTLLLIPGR